MYATRRRSPYGEADLKLEAPKRACSGLFASTGRSWSGSSPPTVVSLPVKKGQKLGQVKVFAGKKLIAYTAARGHARDRGSPAFFGKAGWYGGRDRRQGLGLGYVSTP